MLPARAEGRRLQGRTIFDPDSGRNGDSCGDRASNRLDSITALLLCGGIVGLAWVVDTGHPDAFARPKAMLLQLLVVVGLAVAAVRLARQGTAGLAWLPALDLAVAAFVALQIAAFAFSVDRSQSLVGEPLQLQGLVTVLAYVAVFYLARLVFGRNGRALWLFTAVALTGLGVSLYALAQRADLDPIWDVLVRGRVFSTFGQPNALGAFLVIVIALSVALIWAEPPPLRLLGGAGALVAVPAIALTRSRGAFLGLAVAGLVGAFLLLLAHRRRWRSMVLATAAGFMAATVVFASVAPVRNEAADVWRRATSSVDLNSWDAVQRLALWEVGWAITLDHPVVGTGQETYPLLFPEYRDRVLDRYRAGTFAPFRPESPHNHYIGLAAGSGLMSLAAYLVVIVAGLTMLARAAAAAAGHRRVLLAAMAAATAGHLVTDALMTPETAGSFLFWVLLGAGLAVACDGDALVSHGDRGTTVAAGR